MTWPNLIPAELDAALSQTSADRQPGEVYDVFLAWCQVVQIAAPCITLTVPDDLARSLSVMRGRAEVNSTQELWTVLRAWLIRHGVEAPQPVARSH